MASSLHVQNHGTMKEFQSKKIKIREKFFISYFRILIT